MEALLLRLYSCRYSPHSYCCAREVFSHLHVVCECIIVQKGEANGLEPSCVFDWFYGVFTCSIFIALIITQSFTHTVFIHNIAFFVVQSDAQELISVVT